MTLEVQLIQVVNITYDLKSITTENMAFTLNHWQRLECLAGDVGLAGSQGSECK